MEEEIFKKETNLFPFAYIFQAKEENLKKLGCVSGGLKQVSVAVKKLEREKFAGCVLGIVKL